MSFLYSEALLAAHKITRDFEALVVGISNLLTRAINSEIIGKKVIVHFEIAGLDENNEIKVYRRVCLNTFESHEC